MVADSAGRREISDALSDKSVLRSYCEFGSLHRASHALTLADAFEGADETGRRSLLLALIANSVVAMEDLVLWFHALRKWRPGANLLFDILDDTSINEGRGSTLAALVELSAWEEEEGWRSFGLPEWSDLADDGFNVEAIRTVSSLVPELLRDLTQERVRLPILIHAYNKIKHGALALTGNRTGTQLLIASKRGEFVPEVGKRMVTYQWFDDRISFRLALALGPLYSSQLLHAVLNLVYVIRFDRDWIAPDWPFQRESESIQRRLISAVEAESNG